MKQLLLGVFMTVTVCSLFAQPAWESTRDSLLKSLALAREDSDKALTLIYLGAQYEYNHQDSGIYYFKRAYELSTRLHYLRGIVNGLTLQAGILADQQQLDAAIALDSEAMVVSEKGNYKKGLAAVYNNIAIVYNSKGDHVSSIEYYLKAIALNEELKDSSKLAMAYANIGGVYNALAEHAKGYAYSLNGIKLARSFGLMSAVESGYINLSSALIKLNRLDTALIVLNDAKELAKDLHDYSIADEASNDICAIYFQRSQLDSLKKNATELLDFARLTHDSVGVFFGLQALSNYYFGKKAYSQSMVYCQQSIALAKTEKLYDNLQDAYRDGAKIELVQGHVQAYARYNDEMDSVGQLLLSDKILKNTQELETKYALKKKEGEINDLNKQEQIQELLLRQKNMLNWALAAVAAVIVLISLLYRRNNTQKKKLFLADARLQQQRIVELEKEKQLLAVEAVLQGQVEERSRLAKDLHDGLGSMLSGARFSFSNVKEHGAINTENTAAFDRSIGMLDKSIQELRRVAHNMMPDALMNFGLDTALQDFCESIDASGALRLTYLSAVADEKTIPKTRASAIYRIVQELVNNILKHAAAKNGLVQLIGKDNNLSITVEDDGMGFDTSIIQTGKGMGYLNLKNRLSWLNATMDIQTAPGKGTSVNIEIQDITSSP